MPPKIALSLEDVGKTYGDSPVFEHVNLSFYDGAKIGIVGENGSGKSTLLRIMAGEDHDHFGDVKPAKNLRVKLVPQEPRLNETLDVRGNLELAVKPVKDLLARFEEITGRMGAEMPADEMDALMEDMTKTQEQIDLLNGWEVDRYLDIAADAMMLPPDDADVTTLSGGERRRVALCMALLEKPDMLLLDEPTNHLDAETIAWLEAQLRDFPGTVIIITHDRYFLDNITGWILELEFGRSFPYEGNYSAWLRQKSERMRIAGKKEKDRQSLLKRELDWISASPKGRIKQNKARVQRYEELANKRFEVSQGDVLIQIPPGPKLGDRVLEFDHVCKGYEDVTLIDGASFDLPPGGIVGVVGPNGVGKTTMFRMIMGEEEPDSGTVMVGSSVQLSYVDQNRDALDSANSIFEEISGGHDEIILGNRRMNARAYVARFNFRGAQQQKSVGDLSGGERNRVHLAKLLKSGGNVLLLDEPTNDLDVNTLRVLEEALLSFAGCAMVISHDRFFLDRICTHLLAFEGEGKVRWFNGTFSQYEEQVLQIRDEDRAQRRGKYKRLALH